MAKIRAAIIGSGNIGTDLLIKINRSDLIDCTIFLGRNISSPGMGKAQQIGIPISALGIDYIIDNPTCCDIVFDATSAASHLEHAPILKRLGKVCIDLTPAHVGKFCVPAANLSDCLDQENVNMVTCGGQASVPIAYALGLTHQNIDYVEVVSSIASRSAGPATRRNIDEYIQTTEMALQQFSGARRTKAILNLNPAVPCINMQTTVFAKVEKPNLESLGKCLAEIVGNVQKYVPGYELLVGPTFDNERIVVMVKVTGCGDYLPAYAGNLDIINCAAIAFAEMHAQVKSSNSVILRSTR